MSKPLSLDLSFTTAGTRTVMGRRRYRWPQTIGRLFHLDAADPGHGKVIVQNAGASLHPGDHVSQRIAIAAGARAEVAGQGAMLVTGVPGGRPAVEDTELRAEASSSLVYRPEPRILTEFAHVEQNTEVHLRSEATVVLTDSVVVHPEVTSSSFGSFRSCVTLTVAGEVRMFDAQHAASLPSSRAGLRAFATVYLLGAVLPDLVMGAALDELDGRSGMYAAGTVLPNDAGYAVRIAAQDGRTVRHALGAAVAVLVARSSHR